MQEALWAGCGGRLVAAAIEASRGEQQENGGEVLFNGIANAIVVCNQLSMLNELLQSASTQ
jgi:hypothetical protein